jgi:hypothetical protein
MKKSSLFLLGMLALTLTFGLVFTACPTEDDDSSSSGPSGPVSDIDPALIGTWKDTTTGGDILTLTFSATEIKWGGSVGDALNTSLAAYTGSGVTYAWTAKDGEIILNYTYQGSSFSYTAYTYTLSGDNLELKSSGVTIATLTK